MFLLGSQDPGKHPLIIVINLSILDIYLSTGYGSVYEKNVITDVYLSSVVIFLTLIRSSCLEMLCEKGGLKIFAKFKGKILFQSLFFNKAAGLLLQLY